MLADATLVLTPPASPIVSTTVGATTLQRASTCTTPARTIRRLGRSRSESVRGSFADDAFSSGQLTPPQNVWDRDWDTIAASRGRQRGRIQGEGGLWWDEEMGICWDGTEVGEWRAVARDSSRTVQYASLTLLIPAVQPDLHSIPAYTSNADFVPAPFRPTNLAPLRRAPTPVVFASRLSSFPPRPPLKAPSLPSPPASPVAMEEERVVTPAELVRDEWRRSQLLREQEEEDVFADFDMVLVREEAEEVESEEEVETWFETD